ncbi:fatty acyl-CoA reductase wat [Microplitis demolitor]|uniref:fatty acyl-CoA reductase wat n=1 Tax=Microplitis demolitor TaxID=69319 RepID=UPI0004CD289F|nr:fatty acyl-CoA reductase wat [Microplitis demolitor]
MSAGTRDKLNNFVSDTTNEKNSDDKSEITEFFDGCNVLVTGGSGFVGKLLVEKLLRSCNVAKVYLLMRAKKGKSSEQRYKEHFEDVVYDRLRKEKPDFASKVVMVEGGLEDSGLILSSESRDLLRDSHVIFHGAATVRFDDKLRFAVNINVRGTKEILLYAREMPNLKAIVHIGTAFSNCVKKFIDEVYYDCPIESDKLLTLIDILDDEALEYVTPKIIGKWPNTYAFTKTLAEDVVLKCGKGLPICIVRPSIMIGTYKEPVEGWINNLYGPTGVVVGAGMGLLRSLHCEHSNIADMIPADYVINNIIAAAWDIGTTKTRKSVKALTPGKTDGNESDLNKNSDEDDENPPIYNCVSSVQNPTTWGEFMKYTETYGTKIPSKKVLWYYGLTLNSNLWIHNIYIYLFHLFPAVIIDIVARLAGRKPILLNAYKKIHKFSGVISYFCTQQWKFRNDNVIKLWNKLNPTDRKIFYFHVGEFSWEDVLSKNIMGVRLFLLNDPIDTIEDSKKRYVALKVAHYTVVTMVLLLLLWLTWTFLSIIYSMVF